MTKTQFKFGKQLKGSTYRKCRFCLEYHSSPKQCNKSELLYYSKKESSVKNGDKYRHLCSDCGLKEEDFPPDVYHKMLKTLKLTQFIKHRPKYKKNQIRKDFNISLSNNQKSKKKKNKKIPQECPICLTNKGNHITLSCKHIICVECYNTTINTDTLNNRCPLCRCNMFSENCDDYLIFTKTDTNGFFFNQPKSYTLLKLESIEEELNLDIR